MRIKEVAMRIAMSVKVGVAYPENVAEDLEARAIADNHGGVWSGEWDL